MTLQSAALRTGPPLSVIIICDPTHTISFDTHSSSTLRGNANPSSTSKPLYLLQKPFRFLNFPSATLQHLFKVLRNFGVYEVEICRLVPITEKNTHVCHDTSQNKLKCSRFIYHHRIFNILGIYKTTFMILYIILKSLKRFSSLLCESVVWYIQRSHQSRKLVGKLLKLLSLECLDRQIELNLDEARPDIQAQRWARTRDPLSHTQSLFFIQSYSKSYIQFHI